MMVYRNLSNQERACNEGQSKKNNNDNNVRMSNKRPHSEELARKKRSEFFFSANEQSSRDAIKCKRVKKIGRKKRDNKLYRR